MKDSHHALLCDKCELWFHTHCLKFPASNYSALLNLIYFSLVCTVCGYSKYSHGTPIYFYYVVAPIQPLVNMSDDNKDFPNTLYYTSTPAKNKTDIDKTPPTFSSKAKKVKIMILISNSVKGPSKQAAFHATYIIHKPDIVLGCGSKLCNSMCTYEFFPKNYTVFREDRNVNGGGVFVATSNRIISYDIPDLDTDCEMIWAGLHISTSKSLYLARFFKPPNTTSQPMEVLASS